MTNYRFERVLANGATYVLGTAVEYDDGWRFISNVAAHRSSRKFHPTMERCLPRWVGYPNYCQSVAVKPKHDPALRANPGVGWDDNG
jgi:hypothetical protein